MDYNSNDILLDFFKREIDHLGSLKIKNLENEIKTIKMREMGKIKQEIEESINRYKVIELRSINTDHSSEINKINNKNRRLLMLERQELIDSIFNEAIQKISDYVKTDSYRLLMQKKLKKALDILDSDDTIITYGKEDELIVELLSVNGFKDQTAVASSDIHIGGFIASSVKKRIEINETLDVRLEERKQWFFENSNLFIRE
ncbi:MAG: V-type ATP synthase subunit E [Firmicutes bacterium]|nr:V-type ATP synthase subunit E [Bacillota bacterium]